VTARALASPVDESEIMTPGKVVALQMDDVLVHVTVELTSQMGLLTMTWTVADDLAEQFR
jgi:hypothetical protein